MGEEGRSSALIRQMTGTRALHGIYYLQFYSIYIHPHGGISHHYPLLNTQLLLLRKSGHCPASCKQ